MGKLGRALAVLVALAVAGSAPAQSLTGSIAGIVKDEQGGALPGATVVLVSKTGTRQVTTDGSGAYRFVGLDPGAYEVRAELSGFTPRGRSGVPVSIGKTAEVDFTLTVGQVAETITVTGEAPVVDTSSSSSDQKLDQNLLFNLPVRPVNAAVGLMNFLPGINGGSAFGGDGDTGNALLLDGVDTRDPEGGSAWTFFNFNIVEEVQVSGIGAPAEFGSFTGAVVNTVTRSGGNRFGGLFDVIYSKDSLATDNVTAEQVAQNPSLAASPKLNKLLDFTGQVSGPLVKDELFYFLSVQRFERKQDPASAITRLDEVSPRFNGKLTWQPSPNDTFTGTFQLDHYNIIGRNGLPAADALLATDDLTNREDAPELVWGLQWRHLFGSRTFSEVKYNGWSGYFDLNPEKEVPGHYDAATGLYSDSQGWAYYADRGRNQVNASISHFAEGWGKHDLKFGVEIERSKVRNRFGYVNDIFYYDYTSDYPKGQYYAYNYGYDVEGRNQRESVYVQDSWKVSDRLTLNPGLRFDWVRGYPSGNSAVNGDAKVYEQKNLAPRLGFAFDLTGDNKTVLRGHYGQYYEGIFFLAYSGALPGIEDFVGYDMTTGRPIEVNRIPAVPYRIDPDIKHPRTDEITLGLERAIGDDWRFSLVGLMREDKNLQGSVLPSARWERITLPNALTGGTIPAYRWVNRDASETDQLVTNPDGYPILDASGNVLGRIDASRKYRGLIVTLEKRFTNRWSTRISYVASKTEGGADNNGFDSYGASTLYESATRALTNNAGRPTNDRPHELKVFLTWEVPKVDVSVTGFWRTISGTTYSPFQEYSSSQLNFPFRTGRRIFLEERGSRRLDTQNQLDLRLEKIFRFGGGAERLAVFADVANLFNSSRVVGVQTRAPEAAIGGVDQPIVFGAPTAITAARQVQLGARWSF
ncbi:MAG: TonB-dependent receptor [Vicinamibacteria bacterium]|nr:TonB-dependent receptor [Vicinamibacteria bacterium]